MSGGNTLPEEEECPVEQQEGVQAIYSLFEKGEPQALPRSLSYFDNIVQCHPRYVGYWLVVAGKKNSGCVWVVFSYDKFGRGVSFDKNSAVLVGRGTAIALGYSGQPFRFHYLPKTTRRKYD